MESLYGFEEFNQTSATPALPPWVVATTRRQQRIGTSPVWRQESGLEHFFQKEIGHSFPAQFGDARVQAVTEAVHWEPLESAVRSGHLMLAELIEEEISSDDRPATEAALERGAELLRSVWRAALGIFGAPPKPPIVTPAPRSADFYWRFETGHSFLLTVTTEGKATFAGKRGDGRFQGTVDPATLTAAHLAAWLLNR